MTTTENRRNAPASGAGELWALTLRAEGKRPKTIETYTEGLRSLEAFLGRPADDASKLELRQWIEHMQKTLAPSSVSVRWRSVRRFFVFLVEEERRDDNPTTGIKNPKVPEKVFSMPSEDEITTMLADCDKRTRIGRRDAAIIALLMTTGARRGEVAGLRREDVDFAGGFITFHTSKSQPRRVILTNETALHVKRWMLEPRHTANENLWDVNGPEDLVRRVIPRHSNKRWTTHSLRRSAAVQYHLHGGSAVGMQQQFGWSDPTMASRYARGAAEMINHEEYRRMYGTG